MERVFFIGSVIGLEISDIVEEDFRAQGLVRI